MAEIHSTETQQVQDQCARGPRARAQRQDKAAKRLVASRSSFCDIYDTERHVEDALRRLRGPDALLILLGAHYAKIAEVVVSPLPMWPEEGLWDYIYHHERERYCKELRRHAIEHDATAAIYVARNHYEGLEDDFIREQFARAADEIAMCLHRADVQLLDFLPWWKEDGDQGKAFGRSLFGGGWRAPGHPERQDRVALRA